MESAYNTFSFSLPAKVEFGPGAIKLLPDLLARNGLKKAAFIVTPGRKRSGMLDDSTAALEKRNIETVTYSEVRENPDLDSVAHCAEFLLHHRPDALIALGGGSSLDTAKAAGICFGNGVQDLKEVIATPQKQQSVPLVMIPTTAGSGSEVNYWSVITDTGAKEKLSVGDPAMSPLAAIVDPELCISLPENITLFTGIDALTHAVEAFFSLSGNWLSNTLSLGAVSLIVRSLEAAVDNGENLEARANMSLASTLAGASMANVGLGLIHALSHQVSGHYDTPHGLANALLLPPVLAFNGEKCPEKMDSLHSTVPAAGDFQRWLSNMYKTFGIRNTAISIHRKDIPAITKNALENVNARTNPVKTDAKNLENLLLQGFSVSNDE